MIPIEGQYEAELSSHYAANFGTRGTGHVLTRGPGLPQRCLVLEHPPTEKTFCWVYASCGMTTFTESSQLELFLLSPCQTQIHVELLTVIAHYHQTGEHLGLGHSINFGRPWLPESICSFGLISLPYTFGPPLERARIADRDVRVLWLIPITKEERDFKVKSGLEVLEQIFEKKQFKYLDPARPSVIEPNARTL